MKKLNVGMIGYGFMARTHSNAHRRLNNFFDVEYQPVLKTVCGLVEAEAKAFAQRWGYESWTTDWHKVVEDKSIDLIEICVPNNVHAQIALAAAQAGKMIICEKPLALSVAQAREMVAAVEKAGVPNFVSFNYRRVPAVTLAKQLIDQGRLGASSTIAPTSSRTGRSRPTCRREAWRPGGWISSRPAAA